MRYIIILLCCSIALFAFKIEIIVRTPNNFKSITDIREFIKICKVNHIDSISLLCKQDEDDEFDSGVVFYPSKIAPVAKGYENIDILKEFIKIAHTNGIKVKAWIPQFHDKVAFFKDRKWQMMSYKDGVIKPYITKNGEYFVNPINSQVQKYELSIIEEIVSNYDFDAVILDWVRFDNYNMDLSNFTREDFKKKYGFDPADIDFNSENRKRKLWNVYRSDKIASYIHNVKALIDKKKPNLPLGIYILSPDWLELAQNPKKFKDDIDSILPMCYYDDWNYPLNWIYDIKRDDAILPLTRQKVGINKNIIPVFDSDWEKEIYKKIFSNLLDIREISFFYYGKWTSLSISKIYSIAKK